MADPIDLYLSPNSRLGIELIDKDNHFRDPDFSYKMLSYRIQNNKVFHFLNDDDEKHEYKGLMSPISEVTVPHCVKTSVGIPKEAKWFGFIHPPTGLATKINWMSYIDDDDGEVQIEEDNFDDNLMNIGGIDNDLRQGKKNEFGNIHEEEKDITVAHISVFGGFVYFNDFMESLSISILTVKQTKILFKLVGPFSTHKCVIESCKVESRLQPIPLAIFHEGGIVANAWVRPEESFQSKCSTDQRPTKYGSFLFMKDDGSCFTYTFEKFWSGIDPTGDVDMMGDIIETSKLALLEQDTILPSFVDNAVENYSDSSEWKKYVFTKKVEKKISSANSEEVEKMKLSRMSFTTAAALVTIASKRDLVVRQACHAGVSGEEIDSFLYELNGSHEMLIKGDELGWTPLHHATRFSAQNEALIQILVDRCPESLLKPDECGRLPLHLACASNPSEAVIDILLGSEEGRAAIHFHTKDLKLLPLHIACYQNSTSFGIVKSLLEADHLGTTIRQKTRSGRLALHNAIASKLEPTIIEYLLEADNSLNMEVSPDSDIYQAYQNLLPIHMAIQNQSCVETVSLLLQKDKLNDTFTSHFYKSKNHTFQRYDQGDPISVIFDTDQTGDVFCRRPLSALHLAISSKSTEVVRVFLQKEKQHQNYGDNDRVKSVYCKDIEGRTPLHLACLNNAEPDIIFNLLELDPKGATIIEEDDCGLLPIHYLCRQKYAYPESLKYLLRAKKIRSIYWEKGSKKHSLLLAALCADASIEIIELLMQPNVFSVNGLLKGERRTALAKMVASHKSLQKSIVRELSDKTVFVLLFSRLYANFFTCIFLFICSEQFIEDTTHLGNVTVLIVCTCIFIVREIVQLLSEHVEDYVLDPWNWFEILNIGFLISSISIFQNNHGKQCGQSPEECDVDESILVITGILVLSSTIFSLRSAFLGFARFSSGLTWIVIILVPFLFTSVIFIMIFTYCFRILSVFNATGRIMRNSTAIESCGKDQPFSSCIVYSISDFIVGNEDANTALDLLFGFFAVVILLNVVIAIVSEVWDQAAESATILFWESRIGILSETDFFRKSRGDLNFIEKQVFIPLRSRVSWKNDYPFNQVKSMDQYQFPENYFEPKIAERIRSEHSLSAKLSWLRKESEKSDCNLYIAQLKASVSWILGTVVYLIVVCAGFCSIGLLFPRHIRQKILCAGQSEIGERYNRKESMSVSE